MKLLLIIIGSILISSCTQKNAEENSKVITSYNLLKENAEIPAVCKPPLATEANKRAFILFRGKVNRCVDLVDQYSDLGTFDNIRECFIDIKETFSHVDNEDCRTSVTTLEAPGNAISVINLLRDRFYSKYMLDVIDGKTVFLWNQLENYFSLVGYWYDAAANEFYPKSDKLISKVLEIEIYNNVVKKIWDDLQAYSVEWRETFGEIVLPIATIDPDTGETRTPDEIRELRLSANQKFQIFETMLDVNLKVMKSLLSSELVQDNFTWKKESANKYASPIAAAVIGEAINPFMQRLRTVFKIYDISCKLERCTESVYSSNFAHWFIHYFKDILNGNVPNDFPFDGEEGVLVEFLTELHNNRALLVSLNSGYEDSFEVESIDKAIIGDDMPHILKSYKWLYDESLDFINNYEATQVTDSRGVKLAGYFTTNRVSEVNIGFSKSSIERHLVNVKSANDALYVLRESFNGKKHTLINEVLQINQSSVELKVLQSKIEQDITEMVNTKNQIDALRFYVTEKRVEFYDVLKNTLKDPNISTSDQQFFVHPAQSYQADAQNINTTTSDNFINASLVNLDPGHNFKKGDMISFQVSGQWQPNCAIERKYDSSVSGAKTGPRGFALIHNDGESRVNSTSNFKTKSSFRSATATARVCTGGGFKLFGNGPTVEACAETAMGTKREKGTTSSSTKANSSRTEASFDLGLTLDDTVFPHLPVGALLFVEVPRGSVNQSERRRIYVVKENSSFFLEKDDSDYYLVGNDCGTGNRSGELTVNVTRYEPQGALALSYIDKVRSISDEVSLRVSGLIENGILSFNVLESLRLLLEVQAGPDINNFSGQTKKILQALISNEIAVLDLKSQIVKLERELEAKKQRVLSLLDQFGVNDIQMDLRVQTRNWLLSNMDLDFVNSHGENQNLNTLNRILEILDNSLISYIDFRFRNDERSYIVGDVFGLQSITLTDSFDDISRSLSNYTKLLLERLEDDLNSRPVLPKTTVGLRIKNPFYEPSISIPFPDKGLFPVLDEASSFAFWDSLMNPIDDLGDRKSIVLNLLIRDFYNKNGLSCFTQAPIIETAGMYFIPENEGYITDYNNVYSYLNNKAYLSSISIVPFAEGPREYNFVNDTWRFFDVANRMAISSNDGLRRLTTEFSPRQDVDTGLATGRPLFGSWDFGHLPSLREDSGEMHVGLTPIKKIREVFLGFVISAQNADFNTNLSWINYCQQ